MLKRRHELRALIREDSLSADLIDNYARLPWHRYACDYLVGRTVPLRFSEASPR